MHIAIIMDGNGRWALRQRRPRTLGHRAGADAVNRIVEAAARRRVGTLTLYAFSAANWQRPLDEVSGLFALFKQHLQTQTRRCIEQSIRINVIGRRDRLGVELLDLIERSERATAHCSGMRLRIAVDYSAQHSLIEVCRRLRSADGIDRSRFAETLAAVDHVALPAPEVDLLIRTGGEKRLSRFHALGVRIRRAVFRRLPLAGLRRARFRRGTARVRATRSQIRRHRCESLWMS
jgi:undecaprenyl diphosphate synthase